MYPLAWRRSFFRAKVEAQTLSRPRIPHVCDESSSKRWRCLQINVKQALEALIQKNTYAKFKGKLNQEALSFRVK